VPSATSGSAAFGSAGGLSGFGRVSRTAMDVDVVEVDVLDVVEVVVELLVVEVDAVVVVVVVEPAVEVATAMVAIGEFDSLPQADTSMSAAHATVRDRRRIRSVCQCLPMIRQRPHCLLTRAYACRDADAVVTGAREGDATR
jgi:hypothetical protein